MTAFAVLFIRLFYLQVIKGDVLSRLSENNSIRLQDISPSRGLICDRNGKVLVDNRPAYAVSIIMKDAEPVGMTLKKLARLIPSTHNELMAKVSGKRGISRYVPILLKQDIGREALAAVEVHKYDLPGIAVDVKPRRNYLFLKNASHLLGYLGEISSVELKSGNYADYRKGDLIGKFGAERVFEKYTRGIRGGRQVEVNATGQVVKVLKTVEAHPGHNVFLTIDWELQSKAEELLEGVKGAAVALDPSNGQVLALASSPSFDQNTFVGGISHEQWNDYISDPLKPFTNRAVQGEYPPGSTYKIITAIAGLEEGIIDKDTRFQESCVGHYKFKNREYRCWKKSGHGKLALVDALAESCDVYFYQLGLELGVDKLAEYAEKCGLGFSTGIDLDREAGGLAPTAAWKKKRFDLDWQKGETLSLAIGQSFNLTTPIQMAVLIAAVANGGVRFRPEILKKIEAAEGSLLRESKPKIMGRLPAGEITLDLVKKGLWGVLNSDKGTARGSRIIGLEYSGKTGTAEVVSRKDDEEETEDKFLPDHLKPHAWFIAYAPSESPKIAVSVVVEHGEHGSGAAAPVARELIKTYLQGKTGASR